MAVAAPRSTLVSRRDLRFLLHEWLDAESLTARPPFAEQSVELYDDVLALAEQVAEERFAPHNRDADEREPRIGADGRVELVDGVKEALDAFYGVGLGGAGMPEEVGGMGLPAVVATAAFAYFQAANTGTSGYVLLTTAAANLLLASGSPEQVEAYVRPMVEGRYAATMCLSETQAGSSLADITTRAEPQPDGTYRLTGAKMWISGGEHELAENIIHLVLAKIPGGPPGTRGSSLFAVPRYLPGGERNGVVLAGLNHKMGFRGTVNTVLSFEGARGELVGEPHKGLAAMFHMMNEARIGVGLCAAALGYAGFLKSVAYARERPQGRPPAEKDPTRPQVPIVEHADVRRMLLAQKSYAEGAMALQLYCARLLDDERTLDDAAARHEAHLLLEVLTPIAKSWPAQWCLEANSLAIQVLGGYGYAREYGVEQLYRDNRLNMIHEGTHGIQGLDLLGRKVGLEGGAGLALLAGRMRDTIARATETDERALAAALEAALARLLAVTEALQPADEVALAHASTYLEAAGHVVVAWLWLEQVLAARGAEGDFYDGKRRAAQFFFRYELPRVGPQLDLLAAGDRTTLEMRDAWLTA